MRAVVQPVAEADPGQRGLRAPPARSRRARRRRAARRRRCPAPARPTARWNCWNTKPIRRARSADTARSESADDVVPVDPDRPGRRPVQRADQVQQRRLAGPGRADDGDQLAVPDAQVDLAQRDHAARVGPAHAGQFDHRAAGRHSGTPTGAPSARPSPLTSTRPSANRPTSTATTRAVPSVDDLQAVPALGQRQQGVDRARSARPGAVARRAAPAPVPPAMRRGPSDPARRW